MKTNQNYFKWPLRLLAAVVFFITIYNANAQDTWTGLSITSGAWNDGTNWSTFSAPTTSDNAIIPASYTGFAPVLTGTDGVLALTISTGQTVTVSSGYSLTVAGNLTGSGTLDLSGASGTVNIAGNISIATIAPGTTNNIVLNGATNQNIGAATFDNLQVNNGATLTGNILVNGNLTGIGSLTAGSSQITVKGNMTGITFSAGTSTVILSGSSTQNIDAFTFNNLEADNNSIVLANPEIVNGNLTGSATLAGVTGGSLSIGGNMSVSGYTANTSTVTLGGSSPQTISNAYSLYNLTLDNSAGATLTGGNLTIGHNLVLTSGVLTTDASDLLILSSTLSVAGASNTSFVDGPIKNTALDGVNNSFTFPTGNVNKYAPIGLSNVSDVSQYTVQYFKSGHSATPPGGATASTDEYWTLIENSGTASASVTLNWLDATFSGITTPGDLSVYRTTGSTWADLGSTAHTAASVTASVPASDMDPTFGYYTFGDNSGVNPLPVSLVSFSAQYQDNQVNLNWATASEQNNDYFDVERSLDAANWTSIGQIQGHGTTNLTNYYSDIDNLAGIVPAGTLYYRLKQVDFNGNFTYSMIRSVDISNSVPTVSAYPNPTNTILNVNWTGNLEGNTILKVVNETGSNIYQQMISGRGLMQKQIDMSTLPAGLYFVQLIDGNNNTLANQSIIKN